MEKRVGNGPEPQQSFRMRVVEAQAPRIGVLYERLGRETKRPGIVRFFRAPIIKKIKSELAQEITIADSLNFGS